MQRPKRIRTQRPSYIERKLSKASLKKPKMRKSRTTVDISKAASAMIEPESSSFPLSPEMPKSVAQKVNYHWQTLRKTSVVASQRSLDDKQVEKAETEKVLKRIKNMKTVDPPPMRERLNSLVSTEFMLEKLEKLKREKSSDSMVSSDEGKKPSTSKLASRRCSRVSIMDQVESLSQQPKIKKLTASKVLDKVKLFRDKSSDSTTSTEEAKIAKAALISRRSSRVSIMDQVESYGNPKIKKLSTEKIFEKLKRSTESLSSTASSSKNKTCYSRRCSIMDQVEAYHKPRDGIKKTVFSHLTRRASLVTNWFKDQEDRESMLSASGAHGHSGSNGGFFSAHRNDSLDCDDDEGIGLNNSFDSLPYIDDDSDSCSNGACALSTSPSTSMPSSTVKMTPSLSYPPKSLKV